MAFDLVFMVPLLLRNSIGIEKSALTKSSFGFSIQLMFFFKFYMSTLPPIDQSENCRQFSRQKWRFLTNQKALVTTSDNFQPISELST